MDKYYLCIDLKTFFASVECVERGYDPFKVNLVVANPERGRGAICLAISPKLKAQGIRNRCRLFEIPNNVKYITAMPRMKKYIEYASEVYAIYLKYISKEDIFVYSIDEVFIDITTYLNLYNMTPEELAMMLMNDVLKNLGITATAGIGTNMYLAKIALDITAKHVTTNIGFLTEEKFKEELWHHEPLTDFWQIGRGITKRLEKMGITNQEGISKCDPTKLYKEFGVNAEYLIDHSNGIETCTIKQVKEYKRKSNSISNGQILFRDYEFEETKTIIKEMVDVLSLRLVEENLVATKIALKVSYSKHNHESTGGLLKLPKSTNLYSELVKEFLYLFNKTTIKDELIRKINITMCDVKYDIYEQLELFKEPVKSKEEKELENTVNDLKKKFGKNSLLRGISLQDEATSKLRNTLIGGHASGE